MQYCSAAAVSKPFDGAADPDTVDVGAPDRGDGRADATGLEQAAARRPVAATRADQRRTRVMPKPLGLSEA